MYRTAHVAMHEPSCAATLCSLLPACTFHHCTFHHYIALPKAYVPTGVASKRLLLLSTFPHDRTTVP